jgi:hypothetical protein
LLRDDLDDDEDDGSFEDAGSEDDEGSVVEEDEESEVEEVKVEAKPKKSIGFNRQVAAAAVKKPMKPLIGKRVEKEDSEEESEEVYRPTTHRSAAAYIMDSDEDGI